MITGDRLFVHDCRQSVVKRGIRVYRASTKVSNLEVQTSKGSNLEVQGQNFGSPKIAEHFLKH